MAIGLIWLLGCVAVGYWGQSWGQSFWTNFLGSLLCSPVLGAISVLISGRNVKAIEAESLASGDTKKCPQCAEIIKREAKKCRFCASEVT